MITSTKTPQLRSFKALTNIELQAYIKIFDDTSLSFYYLPTGKIRFCSGKIFPTYKQNKITSSLTDAYNLASVMFNKDLENLLNTQQIKQIF